MKWPVGTSIKGAAWACLFGLFAPNVAQADPSACLEIESDLQRLQCYDTALSRGTGQTLSPEEAYERLQQVVTYSSELVDVSLIRLSGPCQVQVSLKRLRRANAGYYDAVIVFSGVNFADVAGTDRWRSFFSLGSGYPKGLILNYTRGAEGSWTSWKSRAQFYAGFTADQLQPEMLSDRDHYVGRDAMVVVLPEEIAVDQQPVQAAIEGMIRACAG